MTILRTTVAPYDCSICDISYFKKRIPDGLYGHYTFLKIQVVENCYVSAQDVQGSCNDKNPRMINMTARINRFSGKVEWEHG
tara:strand:+ start:720 stop:965 length:246 start_codon:yes stop_codon:yes gene_type:complete